MDKVDIPRLRKKLKITQLEFCNRFGISQSYLSEIENKKKSLTDDLYNSMINEFGEELVNEFKIGDSDNIAIEKKEPTATLMALIESQQRTIESLSKTIENLTSKH